MRAYLEQLIYRIKGSYWFTSMNQPDGARALLATVSGSMITVACVTFSLTILAVSHATSHFGPRLLDNFMRDRGNQITLGTFVATFLYCLLVLRVVRGEGLSGDTEVETSAFVPQLSLMIALILTLASIGELIYFIHHVPDSIHISTVLQRLASVGLVKLSQRSLPKIRRVDEEGDVRIITVATTHQQFVDAMLGQLLPYANIYAI